MKHIRVLFFNVGRERREKIVRLLSRQYDVEILERAGSSSPDLLFYESYPYSLYPILRGRIKEVDCVRVFITGENTKPDFRFFDYAFSYEETDAKNFQSPYFVFSPFFEEFRVGCYGAELTNLREHPKDRFCNFIHRYAGNRQRAEIAEKLMRYKKVDCPGKAFNNMPRIGPTLNDKFDFIKRHKFTIAFENRSAPNYVTEKIYHALLVNSVPIYWGSPRIAEYFNPEAFINCHEYDNFDQVVDRVAEVDNDDRLYRRYVDAPAVLEGLKLHAISDEALARRLQEITDGIGVKTPVAATKSYKCRLPLYYGAWKMKKLGMSILQEIKGYARRVKKLLRM